jgi:hypothetical protein
MTSTPESVRRPVSRRIAERFPQFREPGGERFFEALAAHFAHLEDPPVLPLHFEYAATSNARVRREGSLSSPR